MRPKQRWARPKGLLCVLSIIAGSCPCCRNQRVLTLAWEPWNWTPSFQPRQGQPRATLLLHVDTNIFRPRYSISGMNSLQWRRDLKCHQRLNCKACYQVSGSWKEFCCKKVGFQKSTTLAMGPVLEQSSRSALYPERHQQRALLEKLGTVGTFTPISYFLRYSLPCCGFSCCSDWFVFNELMLLVEIFLRWVTHVSFGKTGDIAI